MGNVLVTLEHPKSVVSESFRMLRTNLHYSNIDKQIKTIMITSPNMSEGKTTTAANLAVSLAQSGKKVLFLGADLRRPKGYKVFGVDNSLGLTTIITDGVLPESAVIKHQEVDNLFILTAGPIPPNPSEILISNKMKSLLESLREDYDNIIIDVPPVNAVTDATILAPIVDGVVLVTSMKQTTKDSTRSAVNALKMVNAHILGAVLSKVKSKNNGYYYNAYYKEDHKKKKGRKPKKMSENNRSNAKKEVNKKQTAKKNNKK